MIATLVTYRRPVHAARIILGLLDEPGIRLVAVGDNEGLGPRARELLGDALDHPRLILESYGENLGAGGARNRLLRHRLAGEGFIRLDDDTLPPRGFLDRGLRLIERFNALLVRFDAVAPLNPQIRLPDAPGPLWVVSGVAADALGGFYQGFGRTLLDDLEYSRRVVELAHRLHKVGCIDARLANLTLDEARTRWNPPWDLFIRYCESLSARESLFVPLDDQIPGVEWTRAGREPMEVACSGD